MSGLYTFPHHTDGCERRQEKSLKNGNRRFWCVTHGQWAVEIPVKTEITYTYGDGTTMKVEKLATIE